MRAPWPDSGPQRKYETLLYAVKGKRPVLKMAGDVLERLAHTDPALTVVHVDRNQGKGHAVRIGLARSQGAVTVIQDADLELDPIQISSLVEPILAGQADVVYGSRFLDGAGAASGMTFLGNRVLTWVTNVLFGASLTDMETCYKVMRGDLARGLRREANRFEIEPEITARLLLAGCRVVERPVRFSPRSKAAGKKIRWRDGVHALAVLIRLRVRP